MKKDIMKKDLSRFAILRRVFDEIGGTFIKINGNDFEFKFTTDDGIVFEGTIPSDIDIYSIDEELNNIVDYDRVMCDVEHQILVEMINHSKDYMAENLLEIVSDWKKIGAGIEIEWNQFKSDLGLKIEDYLYENCTADELNCKLNLKSIAVEESIQNRENCYKVSIDDEDGLQHKVYLCADCFNCAIAGAIEFLLEIYGYIRVESGWKENFPCIFDEE